MFHALTGRRRGRPPALAAVASPAPAVAEPRTRAPRTARALEPLRRISRGALISGALVFALALVAAGYRHALAPDLHIDEFVYSSVGQNVAQGHSLQVEGMDFYWQPPLFFLLETPIIWLAGLTHAPAVDLILHLRVLNAVIGAITAVGMLGLGWRLRDAWTGWAMAILFITDPFVIRVTRRLYLEPFAALWVLLALWFVYSSRGRWTWKRRLAAGLLFGCALLTKELVFFALAVPFVLWLRREVSWREPFVITGVALALYGLYPLWSFGVGQLGEFWNLKLFQYDRLVGVFRYTGWNRSGVSFTDALVQNASDYWTSYLCIALAAPATAWLWFQREPVARFLSAWSAVTYAFFVGLAKFGTLNDQFFYYLMLPVIAVLGYAYAFNLPRLVRQLSAAVRARSDALRLVTRVNLCLVALVLALVVVRPNVQVWVQRFAVENDNGTATVFDEISSKVPRGATIAAPGFAYEMLKFVYPNGEYGITSVRDPRSLAQSGVHWFVMGTKDISIGNGMTQAYFDAITGIATPVWQTDEHTEFHMGLWRVDDLSRLAALTVTPPPDPKALSPTLSAYLRP